ncbi:hypothetical protein COCCADRAFT_109967 [Bipolaris zeicola 26-R-13]|uniref:Zn(2)-C6 fungal-type domain-containing protein n=1 Tax=Cochliobolus carbonum (strain 26-R-13) TaxID=930089 RepID=W6XLJ4_COCC2|nr:uncharacterized protein COCCADRAFT_109967 [Bipolaris zeicola 26-R-13]EUC28132.1 hypothetical protein COCCADRAFT_109967 [Bipolaris zeicola 26-R-13]
MPLRKPHTKSRNGCLPCKKRHIKCGEEIPTCQNCIFRRVDCAYGLNAKASRHDLSRAPSSDATGSPTRFPHEEPPWQAGKLCAHDPSSQSTTGVSRRQELQLMVYYINRTSRTLAHDAAELLVWTEAIPEEAVQYDFLMDGLLAMASLHFAFYNPDSRRQYTEFAIRYQNEGLQNYNKTLGDINETNCTAIFAFSMLINPDDETQAALEKLRQHTDSLLHSNSIDEERHAVYASGIRSLGLVFGYMTTSSHLGRVIGWPAMIWPAEHREALMKLIRHGDIMALTIFMHYGVLLLHIRHLWWGARTGISLIEDLAILVHAAGPNWAALTEWPREVARQTEDGGRGAFQFDDLLPERLA